MKFLSLVVLLALVVGACGSSADPEAQTLYDLAVKATEDKDRFQKYDKLEFPELPAEPIERNEGFWSIETKDLNIDVIAGESALVRMDIVGHQDGKQKNRRSSVSLHKKGDEWVVDP